MGLLLVMMEPPAEHDEEFQAWYDTEHMPQRRAMPGFLSAARWECVEGWPRWLALYDLESLDALKTPEYLAVAGERSTPWTRRILRFAKGYRRVAARQLEPVDAMAMEGAERLLVVAKFGTREEAGHLRCAPGMLQGLAQWRVFECATAPNAGIWVIAGFNGEVSVARDVATVWNVYTPYYQRQRD